MPTDPHQALRNVAAKLDALAVLVSTPCDDIEARLAYEMVGDVRSILRAALDALDEAERAEQEPACPHCGGRGLVSETDWRNDMEIDVTCPSCGGTGRAD